jgi:glycosyltransferase involved in cell wall biosynthesis
MHGLPVLLVDDGSEPGCAVVLDALVGPDVHLHRLSVNGGKGCAVMAGFRAAQKLGWTHALQIDADGQHDAADIPLFIAQAEAFPEHVICGVPIYDDSVPKGRLYGRYLTHVWVWINTLSFEIRDSMCGFRVYALAPVVALIDAVKIGQRMDFDTEVIVRLHWRGVRIVTQPTRVKYPVGGISHFRMVQDNARITAMHTKLFIGMVLRLPLLLGRKLKRWTT